MQWIGGVLITLVAAGGGVTQPGEAVNEAVMNALATARESIEQSDGLDGIVRIGVAQVDGAGYDVTALVQSAFTKTRFDVVLTEETDLKPLLDEFARQFREEDIILKETAHELRSQGVDAVVFGTVEQVDVKELDEPDRKGEQATVRVLLNMASVREENPGSLVWSEQITAEGDRSDPRDFEDKVARYARSYRLALAAVGAVFLLLLFWLFLRRLTRPM